MTPLLETMETRNLMSVAGGSVTNLSGIVTVQPDSNLQSNVAIVSYQKVAGVNEVDVQLNGTDHYFALGSIGQVKYSGAGMSGQQTFANSTGITGYGYGGSGSNLFESGVGQNVFFGGSGANTFDSVNAGYTIMDGGSGSNTYNESGTGSGLIIEHGANNTVNAQNALGHWDVI
jgi:hypothetical protein